MKPPIITNSSFPDGLDPDATPDSSKKSSRSGLLFALVPIIFVVIFVIILYLLRKKRKEEKLKDSKNEQKLVIRTTYNQFDIDTQTGTNASPSKSIRISLSADQDSFEKKTFTKTFNAKTTPKKQNVHGKKVSRKGATRNKHATSRIVDTQLPTSTTIHEFDRRAKY